jgi:hypothetical protein
MLLNQVQYPYLSSLNECVHEVEYNSSHWAKTFGLVTDARGDLLLKNSKIGWLAARVYPETALKKVSFASLFNTWLMFFDDYCDETLYGKNTTLLKPVLNSLSHIMEPCVEDKANSELPLITAFEDLWHYVQINGQEQWETHFKQSLKDFFASVLWEAENREAGTCVDQITYERMRPYTGAMYVVFDLIEIVTDSFLDHDIRNHPIVQEARMYAAKIVCWCNDIFSAKKEALQNDVYNLVLLYQKEHCVTLDDATLEVLDLHNNMLRKFMKCEQAIMNFEEPVATQVLSYFTALCRWIRANFDWSIKDTFRYGMVAP